MVNAQIAAHVDITLKADKNFFTDSCCYFGQQITKNRIAAVR